MKRNVLQKQDWNKRIVRPSYLQDIRQRLAPYSDTPYLDAQVLLSHIVDRSRSWLLAHPEFSPTPDHKKEIQDALKQLEKGVPLPYVVGSWEFYNLRFFLTPQVLIPRPETEMLVDYAIQWLDSHPQKTCCADVGTGSGCMAISIAYHCPQTRFLAGDINLNSLQVARQNVIEHHLSDTVSLFQGHLLQAVNTRFDLIVANLPYIPHKRLVNLAVYENEPQIALDGGEDGLQFIRTFLSTAPHKLSPGGLILLEIDESHGQEAAHLAKGAFPTAVVSTAQDLRGMDRMLIIHTSQS